MPAGEVEAIEDRRRQALRRAARRRRAQLRSGTTRYPESLA